MTDTFWRSRGVTVHRCGPGLLVDDGAQAWLVAVPSAVEHHPAVRAALPRLCGLVVPADHVPELAGWLGILDAAHRAGVDALAVLHPLSADRIGVLCEAWNHGWPDGPRLAVDATAPGTPLDADGIDVAFDGEGGVVVTVDGVRIARTAGAGVAHRRLARDADLAVIVVRGAAPLDLGALATQPGDLWIVDADGHAWASGLDGDT